MRLSIVFLIVLTIVSVSAVACDESDDSTPAPSGKTTHITSTPEITETPSPEPSPEATDVLPQTPELNLSQGQVIDYVMSTEEGGEFGDSRYEVVSEDAGQDITVYTIQADLEMASTCPVTPTTGTATLQVDQFGIPISYQSDFSVGKG